MSDYTLIVRANERQYRVELSFFASIDGYCVSQLVCLSFTELDQIRFPYILWHRAIDKWEHALAQAAETTPK